MTNTSEILRAEIQRLRVALIEALSMAEEMGGRLPAQRCALIASIAAKALAINNAV